MAEPSASLNGSRLLEGWVKDGAFWKVGGQAQQGRVVGVCQAGRGGCNHPEDLFVDNAVREHVTSKDQLGPGRWWLDYANDTIWSGDDPEGRLVETSVVPHAFIGGARNVTIRGLVVEKYAAPGQSAAIVANLIHHNGQLGVGGRGATSWSSGTTSLTTTLGHSYYWEAGG